MCTPRPHWPVSPSGPPACSAPSSGNANAAGIYMLGQEDEFVLEFEDPVEAAGLTDEAVTAPRCQAVEGHDTAVESYALRSRRWGGGASMICGPRWQPPRRRAAHSEHGGDGDVFDAYTEIRTPWSSPTGRSPSLGDLELRQGGGWSSSMASRRTWWCWCAPACLLERGQRARHAGGDLHRRRATSATCATTGCPAAAAATPPPRRGSAGHRGGAALPRGHQVLATGDVNVAE